MRGHNSILLPAACSAAAELLASGDVKGGRTEQNLLKRSLGVNCMELGSC